MLRKDGPAIACLKGDRVHARMANVRTRLPADVEEFSRNDGQQARIWRQFEIIC